MLGKHLLCSGFYLILLLASNGVYAYQAPNSDNTPAFYIQAFNNTDDLDSGNYYLDQAILVSIEVKDSFALSKAYDYKGWVHKKRKEYQEAMLWYKKALVVAKKVSYKEREAIILNHIANNFNTMGVLDSALSYGLTSLNQRIELKDTIRIAKGYNNVANIYTSLNKIDDAIINMNLAADYFLFAKDTGNYLKSVANLSAIYLKNDNPLEAQYTAAKGVEICQGNCNPHTIISLIQKIGVSHFMLGEFDEAEKFLLEGIDLSVKSNIDKFSIATYRVLAKVYLEKGNANKFLENISESILLATDKGDLQQLKEGFLVIGNYYSTVGDYKTALLYKDKYMVLQDSLFGHSTMNNVEKIHLDYLQKQAQQAIQQAEATIRTKNRENQLMKIIGGLFLVLVLGGWRSYYVIRKKNKTIEDQNDELHKFNDSLKKDMVKRTNELEETSKVLDNFIYRTSHDIRGPIASLKGLSHVAQLEVDDQKANEYFNKISQTASNMEYILDGLREVNLVKYKETSPEKLDLKDILIKSVNDRKNAGYRKDIGITIDSKSDAIVNTDSELAFIAIDKIIDNAFKFHSKFSPSPSVFIRAYKFNGGVKVEVTDNGIGIDKDQIDNIFGLFERASDQTQFGGIGLYVALLAINRLGGSIRADRDEESGLTLFEIYFPDLV